MKVKKLILIIIVLFSLTAVLPAGAQSFSDVPAGHWSYEAINKLVQAGIVEGYPDGEYKGKRKMSRYEMAVMVGRAIDTIESEMEAMDAGLNMAQAQDAAAVVRALMEKNTQDELSNQQIEDVADIIDALTYELADELRTLGVEVGNLAHDVKDVEAKIAEMNIPKDNIEFAAEVRTSAEIANYDAETNKEIAAAMKLWADSNVLDLDLPVNAAGDAVVPQAGETISDYLDRIDDWKDADDLPAEQRFWQEYDFLIRGSLGAASFDLELDTVSNVFNDEKSAFAYAETDQNFFKMDTGLLTIENNQPLFNRLRAGDIDDYHINRYFVDEEDTELLEVTTSYLDLEWTFMTGGFGQENNDELYLIRTAKEFDSAKIFGEINQMRGLNQITNFELGLRDYSITDSFKAAAQAVFNSSKAKDKDDIFFNLRGDYAAADDLDIYAVVDSAGEEFTSYKGDLEEDYDFDLFKLGADYQINENNELQGAYSMVQIGDQIQSDVAAYNDEDKSIFELALNNNSGAFKNKLALEYTVNDNYTDNYETRVIELCTEYAVSEKTTAAAAFINKDENNDGRNVINYNYFKGNLGMELAENVCWENEAKYILGDAAEVEGESSAFTTSLIVNF